MADKVNLVSLGDSIATGTLTPFSSTYSFVFYLMHRLRGKGLRLNVYNLANDGDTSQELLWKLRHSHFHRRAIEKADMITVSIGGNDLLRASSIPGFTRINVPVAQHMTRNLMRNWPQIIDTIRSINGHARIVALNIYNPYNETQYLAAANWEDRGLSELTDQLLAPVNRAIAAHACDNYAVANVYSAFKQFAEGMMWRVTCLYPTSLMRNPHPTPWAHRVIAKLVFQQFCV